MMPRIVIWIFQAKETAHGGRAALPGVDELAWPLGTTWRRAAATRGSLRLAFAPVPDGRYLPL